MGKLLDWISAALKAAKSFFKSKKKLSVTLQATELDRDIEMTIRSKKPIPTEKTTSK